MTRAVRLVIGVGLVALAVQSTYDFVLELRGLSQAPDLPGIQTMLAVAMAVTGFTLVRQSLLRVPRAAVGTYSLAMFGYGWLAGVIVNNAISLIRAPAPRYDGPFDVAIDLFSWLVVTAILAVPGLICVFLARKL